ncbi:MAG TPA: thioredoxin family protein [Saprospiraceae bacterium]|nr:thioredoxin family protein [Saprospiraceae bacterium]
MRILFIFIALCAAQYSQAQINFNTSSWEELLTEAATQNKLIYVDAYTTWCGPCKMMKKNTFPNPAVGTFFNANFINAQIDMEKGEGPGLAKKYGVMAYPTHLVIDGNGRLIHRGLGYMEADDFLEFGHKAIDPQYQLAALNDKYAAGERSDEFLNRYFTTLIDISDPSGEKIAGDYFATHPDLSSPLAMQLLMSFGIEPSSSNHSYLLKNKEKLTQKYQTEFLSSLAFYYYVQGVNDKQSTDRIIKNLATAYPAEKDILAFYVNYRDAQRSKDLKRSEQILSGYLTKGNYERFSSSELNSYAWFMFENSTDKKALKQATEWAQESVRKKSEFANNDTVANLYFKSGNKKQAKKYAEIAIKLGKAAGEDTSSTEELLKKL